jgi:hypothetical protein
MSRFISAGEGRISAFFRSAVLSVFPFDPEQPNHRDDRDAQ